MSTLKSFLFCVNHLQTFILWCMSTFLHLFLRPTRLISMRNCWCLIKSLTITITILVLAGRCPWCWIYWAAHKFYPNLKLFWTRTKTSVYCITCSELEPSSGTQADQMTSTFTSVLQKKHKRLLHMSCHNGGSQNTWPPLVNLLSPKTHFTWLTCLASYTTFWEGTFQIL